MELYLQLALNGIVNGAVYGLLALGFVVIYRASKVLNFAQAGIGAVAAYVLFSFVRGTEGQVGLWLLGLVVGLGVAIVVGVATERVVVRPLRNAPQLATVIATVALLVLLQAVLVLLFGGDIRSVPDPVPSAPLAVGSLVGLDAVVLPTSGVVMLGTLGLIAVGLTLLLQRTKFGLAVRALSDDLQGARELGVHVNRTSVLAWVLGAGVAAVAIMLFASFTLLSPIQIAVLQIKALVVAVFASLTDLRLCVIGGLLLGVVESLSAQLGVPGLAQSVGFFLLLAILLLRAGTLAERLGEARAT